VTPEGNRGIWQPHILERAFVSRYTGWRVTPDQLDGLDHSLKQGIEALIVFDAFRQYATNLDDLSGPEQEIIKNVEKLRDQLSDD
jgi:hypothetical protein